jgi:hypothetical protein
MMGKFIVECGDMSEWAAEAIGGAQLGVLYYVGADQIPYCLKVEIPLKSSASAEGEVITQQRVGLI